MIKNISLLLLLACSALPLSAQTLFIHNIDKPQAYIHDTLTLAGDSFGTDPADVIVTFGAMQGEVVSVQDHLLKVVVPAGATFGPVAVTRLSQHLTVYSSFFLPAFPGNAFTKNNLSTLTTLSAEEAGLYDLCACDFDGDGDNDLGTTNDSELAQATSVDIYANQTTAPGQLSFQKVVDANLNINSPARNITCADLDGDGKPDLIVSQGGSTAEQVFIFKNISTESPRAIRFEAPQMISVADAGPTHSTRRLTVQDLNRDGLPDIVVTNQAVNKIFILKNESRQGTLLFNKENIVSLEVPGNTLGLAVVDLNKDKLPEIIAANNVGSGLYLLENRSTPAKIQFASARTLAVPGPLAHVAAGDLDGDTRPDLAVANLETNTVFILLNTTNEQDITLSAPVAIPVGAQPWGLDISDMDGNGQTDLLVASLSSADSITLLANHSLPGSLNFTPYKIGTPASTRNLKAADLNGDGKPELCFTAKEPEGSYLLGAVRNTTCLQAAITPGSPVSICQNRPVALAAPPMPQVTYQWKKDGADIPNANTHTLSVTSAGSYTVRMESATDGCASESAAVPVTQANGTPPETPVIHSHGAVCAGEDVQLSTDLISGVTYHWYGPDGFTSAEQNPLLSGITPAQAGEYFLEVKQGDCYSATTSTTLQVYAAPAILIQTESSPVLCEGEVVLLSVGESAAVSYQWKRNGSMIEGAQAATLEAAAAGTYSVVVTTANGCQQESKAFVVSQANLAAHFEAPDKACAGEEITFVNQLEASAAQRTYFWDFGDGNTSSEEQPMHVFETDGVFPVTLKIMYENTACVSEFTQNMEIIALPQVTVLPDEAAVICAGDTLALRLDGVFSSLTWQDGSTYSTLLVTAPGDYSVTAYNEQGCSLTRQISVTERPAPIISIQVAKNIKIIKGESVILTASGASRYVWTPAESLDDPHTADPVATPERTTTYTVTGYDAEGCKSTAEVTIQVSVGEINVTPRTLFSPNGDEIDDYWQIENIESYPECAFTVFNMQGRQVYQSATGYYNDWSGTDQGGIPLTEGVYYYVIRCGGKENKKSGSVTIVR